MNTRRQRIVVFGLFLIFVAAFLFMVNTTGTPQLSVIDQTIGKIVNLSDPLMGSLTVVIFIFGAGLVAAGILKFV